MSEPIDSRSRVELVITSEMAGLRLDRLLAEQIPGMSRAHAQAIIKRAAALVNGRPAKSAQIVEAGQSVTVDAAPQASENLPAAEAIPLPIVYEDDYLLVVNKPSGMVTHPAPGHSGGTLVNALLAHLPGLAAGGPERPGIVHRLDKDTSGLLVVAKDNATHAALAQQMKDHAMIKRYLALVEGAMPTAEGVIEAPVGRDPRQRQRMGLVGVAQGGREARTRFRVLEERKGRTLLELQLETGRTHQIRVHLAAIHRPVVGDVTYGTRRAPHPPRQFLHAARLEFAHPATGAWVAFEAPLPPDLAAFLARWRDETRTTVTSERPI